MLRNNYFPRDKKLRLFIRLLVRNLFLDPFIFSVIVNDAGATKCIFSPHLFNIACYLSFLDYYFANQVPGGKLVLHYF